MTREDMHTALRDIHKYLADRNALYWQVRWILGMLDKEYTKKGCKLLELTGIKEIAAVESEKERLR